MEPKLIKEEVPDRDNGSSSCISNGKELSRGGRQSTPPTHPEGGAGPASRTPKTKGKSLSLTAIGTENTCVDMWTCYVYVCVCLHSLGTRMPRLKEWILKRFAEWFIGSAHCWVRTMTRKWKLIEERKKKKQKWSMLDGEENSCLKTVFALTL
jgi:hypothetical protein